MHSWKTLSQSIGSDTRTLFDHLWSEFQTSKAWPTAWSVHSTFGKKSVLAWLANQTASVVVETDNGGTSRYELTLLGVLATRNGPDYWKLLERYIGHLRHLYKTRPQQETVSSAEASSALELDSSQTELLGQLISMGSLFSRSSSHGSNGWNVGILQEIEDCDPHTTTSDFLEHHLMKRYIPDSPVSVEARRQQMAAQYVHPGIAFVESKPAPPPKVDIDPEQRRYQVFVSSTYTDLKLERQAVMQALLQTMCIPVGMELFPATGWEQLKLIKRVIDDSDYYILILAGRYGSCPPQSELSFTELEFDYAVSKGKYIMVFCHENIGDLKASLVEPTDAGKAKLEAFRKKAMTGRTGAHWTNPHELGSHVKTAIAHAIREEPQPGWVRARSIAPLNERQVDDDSVPKKPGRARNGAKAQITSEPVTYEVRVSYSIVTNPKAPWDNPKKFSEVLSLPRSGDEVLLLLGKRLEKPTSTDALKGSFQNRLEHQFIPKLQAKHAEQVRHVQCSIKIDAFQLLLDELHARDCIGLKPAPRGEGDKGSHWALTRTGAKHLSTLRLKQPAG